MLRNEAYLSLYQLFKLKYILNLTINIWKGSCKRRKFALDIITYDTHVFKYYLNLKRQTTGVYKIHKTPFDLF